MTYAGPRSPARCVRVAGSRLTEALPCTDRGSRGLTSARRAGRVADKPGVALASVAARHVDAVRVGAAWRPGALVHVDTCRAAFLKAALAEALALLALSVVDAVEVGFAEDLDVNLSAAAGYR